jgi:hypothetical protein
MHIPSIRDGLLCSAAICVIVASVLVVWYLKSIRDDNADSRQKVVELFKIGNVEEGK